VAEADSRCSPDERSDFIAGACIDRREASRNPQRGGVMASVPPKQTIMPSQVFRGGPLLFVRLGSRRSVNDDQVPTELFNLSENHFLIFG
jgi:hypothetical protein